MATLQQQARALGDPTRHAVFGLVAESPQPIGIAELNEHFDLHPNAIRQHLSRLVEADLVVETTAPPAGRGRPRLVYTANPAVAGRWGTDGPYEELSSILAEIVTSGRTPVEVGRDAAERFRVPSPSGDLVDDVTAAMARQGFDPEVAATADGAEIVLRRCPFASVAREAPETVCAIHLGIAEGLLDGADAVVSRLDAHDPHTAGCRLRIELAPSDDERRGADALSVPGRRAAR